MSTGPLQAEVLEIISTHYIYVRLCSIKDIFCLLQQSLTTFYCNDEHLQFTLQPETIPRPGQSYAVSRPAAWYRGVINNINKDMDTTLVRLIDVGRLVEVSASSLTNLAPQFPTENVIPCPFVPAVSAE